jgi:hypothetical protein
MTENTNNTAELAFRNSKFPERSASEVQREIERTMRDLIADCRRGPGGFDPTNRERAPTVTVGGAVPARSGGSGWREGAPLHSHANSTTNALIDGLALAMQPHGPQNPAQPKPRAKAEEEGK